MKTRFIALSTIATVLAACSSTPGREPQAPRQSPTKEYTYSREMPAEQQARPPLPTKAQLDLGFNPATADSGQISIWLEQAATAPQYIAAELKLRAAEVLLRDGETAQADDVVSELILPELDPGQAVRLAIVRARVLRSYGEFSEALDILADPLLDNYLPSTPARRQIQFSQMRATLFAIEGDNLSAAKEWIFIHPLLTSFQQGANRESIWQALMQIPTQTLQEHISSDLERDYRGWLELAAIAKDNQGDIDAQIRQRDAWLARWRDHPARDGDQLPGGLNDLNELIVKRPEQVALLLPVSGKLAPYGKAIRDGFVAAYYEAREQGAKVPIIRLYDSGSGDINQLYQRIASDGNNMVIGPLHKNNLDALAEHYPNRMPLPTLALNRIDGARFPAGFYQFGLNPEDEAIQVADITRSKGFERALILSPQGSWGSKVSEAFANRWQQAGGEVITSTSFDAQSNNYSKQIKEVLQLNASEQRRRLLQQIIGVRPEFEPYRRSDIDVIFLVARPNEGRSIIPLLAYHYAGDLPVFATSHIYRGVDDPTRDQDINGVNFVDIPWVFDHESKIRKTVDEDIPGSGPMQRMYALGVDSFRLHLRLAQLHQGGDASVFGETGTLTLNPEGQIERQLVLAKIRNGQAELIVSRENSESTGATDGDSGE